MPPLTYETLKAGYRSLIKMVWGFAGPLDIIRSGDQWCLPAPPRAPGCLNLRPRRPERSSGAVIRLGGMIRIWFLGSFNYGNYSNEKEPEA